MESLFSGLKSEKIKRYKTSSKNMSSSISDFKKEMKLLKEGIKEEFSNVTAKTMADFFDTLVDRTPILTGNARMNWFVNTLGKTDVVIPYPKSPSVSSGSSDSSKLKINKMNLSGDKPDKHFIELSATHVSEVTMQKLSALISGIRRSLPDTVYIFNNAEHIEALEAGRSKKQAPRGMLALTIQEFPLIQRKYADQSELFK